MIERYLYVIVIACAVSGTAVAGQISGTIAGAPNQPVTVSCGAETGTGQTDANGRYSVFVNATGQCNISVAGKTAHVFSSTQPTRANFRLTGAALKKN